jgi:hypothetical protein
MDMYRFLPVGNLKSKKDNYRTLLGVLVFLVYFLKSVLVSREQFFKFSFMTAWHYDDHKYKKN